MQPKTYDNLSAAEETHWWFRHRRAVTLECLRRARIAAIQSGTQRKFVEAGARGVTGYTE